MTDKQRQIAEYVAHHRLLSRYTETPSMLGLHVWPSPLYQSCPTVEQFAQELLKDSEFRALQLGNWLRTPEGEAISQAVSIVIPEAYGPAFNLAVDGLTLAAELQAKEGRQKAEGVALAVGVCVVLVLVIGAAGGGA